jgi:hypothetical protein
VPERTTDPKNGQRAAIIAGLLGLVPAVVLGGLRFINQEPPEIKEQVLGNLVFALALACPYLLVLAVARTRDPAARGSLLLALGILSLAASFVGLSGVTLVLLPATIAIFAAAGRSLWAAGSQVYRVPLFLVPGLLGAAAVGFSFYALFLMQGDDPRCWVLKEVEGREEWQSLPVPPRSESGGMRMGPFGPEVRRSICVGTIITSQEAALGLAGIGAGFLVILAVSRLPLQGGQLWNGKE